MRVGGDGVIEIAGGGRRGGAVEVRLSAGGGTQIQAVAFQLRFAHTQRSHVQGQLRRDAGRGHRRRMEAFDLGDETDQTPGVVILVVGVAVVAEPADAGGLVEEMLAHRVRVRGIGGHRHVGVEGQPGAQRICGRSAWRCRRGSHRGCARRSRRNGDEILHARGIGAIDVFEAGRGIGAADHADVGIEPGDVCGSLVVAVHREHRAQGRGVVVGGLRGLRDAIDFRAERRDRGGSGGLIDGVLDLVTHHERQFAGVVRATGGRGDD